MYWIAPDRNKSGPMIEQLAYILQSMIHEGESKDPFCDESAEEQVKKDE
jgi:hypothetical protein